MPVLAEIFESWYKMTEEACLKGIPRPGLYRPFRHHHSIDLLVLLPSLVLATRLSGIGRIIKSPLGLSLMAPRDNEQAIMMGIHPLPYKVFVFVFPVALQVGGSLTPLMEFPIQTYSFSISVDLFLMVMLGGSGRYVNSSVSSSQLIRRFSTIVALRFLIYGFLWEASS
jgi:ABC-type branched-subunit amino acid transport system permease subunit